MRTSKQEQQGENIMGIWDGIENAESYDRGNYLAPGFVGVCEVVKTLVKQTRAAGPAFIVELRIVESNLDRHPVGSKVSWFQKLTDKAVAFPSVAEWAAATAGLDPTDREMVKQEIMPELRELMEHATDNPSNNSFVGQLVKIETVHVLTKTGRDFTRHTFSPVAA